MTHLLPAVTVGVQAQIFRQDDARYPFVGNCRGETVDARHLHQAENAQPYHLHGEYPERE